MTFASPNHHSSATGFPCAASRVSVGKSSRVVATLTSNRSAGKLVSVPEVIRLSGADATSSGLVTTRRVVVTPSGGCGTTTDVDDIARVVNP